MAAVCPPSTIYRKRAPHLGETCSREVSSKRCWRNPTGIKGHCHIRKRALETACGRSPIARNGGRRDESGDSSQGSPDRSTTGHPLQRHGGYLALSRRDEIGLKLGARQPGMFALRLDETLLAMVMRNPEWRASHVVLPSGEPWRPLLARTNSDYRSALVF
jgi:hypothetical protein